jgi:hypothetical protein
VKAYQLTTVDQAKSRLKAWCRWARMGSRRFGALFTEMEKFAGSVVKHMAGILTHWKHRITNAFTEGLNSVFNTVKPRSSGFRSIEYLTTMLYFVAANSGFLPSSHPPKTTRNQILQISSGHSGRNRRTWRSRAPTRRTTEENRLFAGPSFTVVRTSKVML